MKSWPLVLIVILLQEANFCQTRGHSIHLSQGGHIPGDNFIFYNGPRASYARYPTYGYYYGSWNYLNSGYWQPQE